jgi:hypothetical protein
MCAIGFLVLALAAGEGLWNVNRGLVRVTLPGTHSVNLKAGMHVGLVDPERGRGISRRDVPLFSVTVEESATGGGIPVQMNPPVMAAAIKGAPLIPLFQFETFEKGTHIIRGVVAGERTLPVLLTHESMSRTGSDLMVGLTACVLLNAGGVFFIWRARRLRKSAGI